MAERMRKTKPKQENAPAAEQTEVQPKKKSTEELKAETDALLAEIDDVLDDIIGEGTAQDFVKSYQQKGGE